MNTMVGEQPKNPLHGITLKDIVEDLVQRRGWEGLSAEIDVRCFSVDPSVKSSLAFLRKTKWARQQVEGLYLADQRALKRKAAAESSC